MISLSQLLPHMGVFAFQLHFFTWLLWTKFSRKFQIQKQQKIFLSWLIQAAQRISCHSGTTSKELELERNFLRYRSMRLFCRAGGCGEPRLSDVKMALYWQKDGEGRTRLQPITGFALLWLHMNSKTREWCPALELGRAHWFTWLAPTGFSIRC